MWATCVGNDQMFFYQIRSGRYYGIPVWNKDDLWYGDTKGWLSIFNAIGISRDFWDFCDD